MQSWSMCWGLLGQPQSCPLIGQQQSIKNMGIWFLVYSFRLLNVYIFKKEYTQWLQILGHVAFVKLEFW